MSANGVRGGLLSPRDGRVGPRGLRRGAVSAEAQRARRGVMDAAVEASGGDRAAAIGMLAGCLYELVFRHADAAGPPQESRPTQGATYRGIGGIVLQATSRVLKAVSQEFREEARRFENWTGEHIDDVQARIAEAAHLFGVDVAKQVVDTKLRIDGRDGQPVTRDEFDEESFERRVHELHGKALRYPDGGPVGGLYMVLEVVRRFIDDLRESGNSAAVDEALAVHRQLANYDLAAPPEAGK